MAEAFSDYYRPSPNSLDEIRELPGACRQVWELGFMMRTLPVTKHALTWRPFNGMASFGEHLRTQLVASMLMDRIQLSLELLAEAAAEERRGEIAPMAGTPLAERQFTFADVAYLACGTMVERGLVPRAPVPNEDQRQVITEELLVAAPEVCQAFNSAIALLSLPLQRESAETIDRTHA